MGSDEAFDHLDPRSSEYRPLRQANGNASLLDCCALVDRSRDTGTRRVEFLRRIERQVNTLWANPGSADPVPWVSIIVLAMAGALRSCDMNPSELASTIWARLTRTLFEDAIEG